MKPSQNSNRKLNLNKQTVQKLDSNKLANVYAGVAQEEAGTTTILLSIATSPGTVVATAICTVSIAL